MSDAQARTDALVTRLQGARLYGADIHELRAAIEAERAESDAREARRVAVYDDVAARLEAERDALKKRVAELEEALLSDKQSNESATGAVRNRS